MVWVTHGLVFPSVLLWIVSLVWSWHSRDTLYFVRLVFFVIGLITVTIVECRMFFRNAGKPMPQPRQILVVNTSFIAASLLQLIV